MAPRKAGVGGLRLPLLIGSPRLGHTWGQPPLADPRETSARRVAEGRKLTDTACKALLTGHVRQGVPRVDTPLIPHPRVDTPLFPHPKGASGLRDPGCPPGSTLALSIESGAAN